MPEALWFELCRRLYVVEHGVAAFFAFSGRYVSDGHQQSPVVESVDRFQRGEFDGFEGSPWFSPVNDLGLVKAIEGARSARPETQEYPGFRRCVTSPSRPKGKRGLGQRDAMLPSCFHSAWRTVHTFYTRSTSPQYVPSASDWPDYGERDGGGVNRDRTDDLLNAIKRTDIAVRHRTTPQTAIFLAFYGVSKVSSRHKQPCGPSRNRSSGSALGPQKWTQPKCRS